jgi:outer membrane protein assembly factor BamB
MSRYVRFVILVVSFLACSTLQFAQEDFGWRISPENINVQVGEERSLQVLDDAAQELRGAVWTVDNPDRAEVQEEAGRVVIHAKSEGTVLVSAALGGETRFREIKIWPADKPIPQGTTKWGTHPIGRDLGDIPSVPTAAGAHIFSLEQTTDNNSYLRAVTNSGFQDWIWLMPEKTHEVELVCGDWLGGALISANRSDSFTLYAVGSDGKLRWQHTESGTRKAIAISTDHVVYLVSQSKDQNSAKLTGIDEAGGAMKFDLPLPGSREVLANVRNDGSRFACTSTSTSKPSQIKVSRVIVNMDGLAYLAFSQNTRTTGVEKCMPGAAVDAGQVYLTQDQKLMLWQIHPDGRVRSTVVEESKGSHPLSAPVDTFWPTTAIVTDNNNGMLIPVQVAHGVGSDKANEAAEELIYRVDPNGEVLYKFAMPKYAGALHDEMVIGEHNVAFATRGGMLIAFDLAEGKELWTWESKVSDITVFAALANGHCLVQTPTALVEVADSNTSREIFQGKAMMDWMGNMYRKKE